MLSDLKIFFFLERYGNVEFPYIADIIMKEIIFESLITFR